MKKVLLIIGICIIWSNTLCAQITVDSRTEKRNFVDLLHKKRNSSFLYQKRDSTRLAKFEHQRDIALNLKSRDLRKAIVKIDNASYAKRLGESEDITSKTVNETTAGTLSSYFTDEEISSVSSLTITGKMDARDFKFIRNIFNYRLLDLDISGVTIEEYTGTEGTDTVGRNKTYPANTIPQYSFWNGETHRVKQLSSIVLPSTITTIGAFSFLAQKYLSTITIPSSVTTIKYHAFEQCSFTSIAIPSSVVELEAGAFSHNTELITARIASSTTGAWTFENDTLLSSVTFEPTVKKIGAWAFENCKSLKSAVIAADTIGEYAFFSNNLTSLTLTDDVSCIQHSAFGFSDSLTSVTIPSSVTEINSAFEFCPKLVSATILSKTTGDNTFSIDTLLSSVTFGSCVQEIGEGSFELCCGLTSINIPGTVSTINDYAFWGSGLTSIVLNEGIRSIGGSAFEDTYLSSIIIPASVDYIGYSSLPPGTSITVSPDNVSYSSDHGVLFNKDQTKLVYYPGFEKSYTIPSTVKTIAKYAFFDDTVSSITIPASVRFLEPFAFELTSDTFSINFSPGSTLREISYGAFADSYITAINIPTSVKTIGFESFAFCSKLKTITIPASVDTIKPEAFVGCDSLQSIYLYAVTPPILPDSVIEYFEGELDTISGRVFGYYYGTDDLGYTYSGVDTTACVLHVPFGSKILYQKADQWKSFTHIEEDLPSSINNINAPSLSISLNPATKEFTVLGLKGDSKLVLADSSGRIVMQKCIVPDQYISVAGLMKGLYLANIDGKTIKFIVK